MNLKDYAKQQGWTDVELKKYEDDWKIQDEERRIFMKQYNKDHECCPKCGETSHSTTFVGFIYYADSPEEYKDRNNCTCRCGDKHEFHDRVPLTNT